MLQTIKIRILALLMAMLVAIGGGASVPDAVEEVPGEDFAFTTRDEVATTFLTEIERLNPEAQIYLLLFDPDCNDCHQLMADMEASPEITEGIADGSVAVFAIFPVDEPLPADDPNMMSYRRVCAEMPESWTVGIDNGSLFATDAFQWESLPKFIKVR